jgi:hypothetical protein
MKKLSYFLFLWLVLLLGSCQRPDDAPELPASNPPNGSTDPINLGHCGATASTDLLAGQHTVIGKVTVIMYGSIMRVIYQLNAPNWGIMQTHLSVKPTWDQIPMTGSGNPIPGQFEYKNDHNHIIGYYYDVDVSGMNQVSIAAHCKVENLSGNNPNPIDALVPGMVLQMDVDIFSVSSGQSTGFPYYLGLNLSSLAGSGFYDGFCVDKGSHLSGHITYDAMTLDPFVSDDALLNCLGIDQPQNMDLIAYIINQYYAGAYGNAQAEELQIAIWNLMEPSGSSITTNEFTWDQIVVDAILQDAPNGEGFVPGLCDYRFLLMDTKCSLSVQGGDDAQTVINVIVPQDCTPLGEETAWGFGPQFPGKNWGMYFNYCVQ